MYELTLTSEEREAIDWIGNRYAHGDELYAILTSVPHTPTRWGWGSKETLTFNIPEHLAWGIQDAGEECEYRWDCFAPELVGKLDAFCDQIV